MAVNRAIANTSRLPPLPTIKDILKLYNLQALRQLSQNFLLDERLNNKIVRCCGKLHGVEVCEIGPGPGNITRSILARGAKRVFLIEKDPRFLPCLKMLKQAAPADVEIILGDVMNFSMEKLFSESHRKLWNDGYPSIQLIGNLPFNVSTALIIKYMRAISEKQNAWSYGRVRMTLTFQKEVAERMEATVMSAQRCRLSVMCQNWCEVQHRFVIPGKAFLPKPDVDVGVVHFKPRVEPIIALPFDLIEKVVTAAYRFRQRYASKGLRTLFPDSCADVLIEEMMNKAQIDPVSRPFQLSVKEIGNLCRAYKEIIDKTPSLFKYTHHSEDDDWLCKERDSELELQRWKNNLSQAEFY